jgi:hypothetical protein
MESRALLLARIGQSTAVPARERAAGAVQQGDTPPAPRAGKPRSTTANIALADHAWVLGTASRPARVLVYCNSRDHALKVKKELESRLNEHEYNHSKSVELLVGARRVHEREALFEWLKSHGFVGDVTASPDAPTFLVATSAGEVGVDLDADHMVCDLVEWERMVQRLGRVNRRGRKEAQIRVTRQPRLPIVVASTFLRSRNVGLRLAGVAKAGLSVVVWSGVLAGTYLGIPVSTTHTIIGCIIGVGAARRVSAVRWKVTHRIVPAWIITIPAAGAIAALWGYEMVRLNVRVARRGRAAPERVLRGCRALGAVWRGCSLFMRMVPFSLASLPPSVTLPTMASPPSWTWTCSTVPFCWPLPKISDCPKPTINTFLEGRCRESQYHFCADSPLSYAGSREIRARHHPPFHRSSGAGRIYRPRPSEMAL